MRSKTCLTVLLLLSLLVIEFIASADEESKDLKHSRVLRQNDSRNGLGINIESPTLLIPGIHEIPPEVMAQLKVSMSNEDLEALYSANKRVPPSHRRENFRNRLALRIKGQPEVIDALINIEDRKKAIGLGRREVPEVLYLTGLPGTGKDTTAKAYVDSMHGQDAHKQHMYVMPVAKSRADLWRTFGSNTGYFGSKNVSDFIRFLVDHSGGRYIIKKEDDHEFVVEDENWKTGQRTPGTFIYPENTVVYIDEFHNWSREAKDSFFKQAFEKGFFPINAPGPGLSKIYVPVTFIIASNECLELITARDMYGRKVGKSQTYEQLYTKWQRVQADKKELKRAIRDQGVMQMGNETVGGLSEELANRIPDRNLLLMRPLEPNTIRQIAIAKIEAMEESYASAGGDFGKIFLDISDDVIDFIATYQTDIEDGARSIEDKVVWIENAIMKALYEHGHFSASGHRLSVNIKQNNDRTYSLLIGFQTEEPTSVPVEVQIAETLNQKPVERFPIERIRELSTLSARLRKRVFGIGDLADKLQSAMMISEEKNHAISRESDAEGGSARVFMFLGLSSTGKTETAKVLADLSPGGKEAMRLFDFRSVRSVHDLKEKILGTKDEFGRPKKSPFMEHYDKFGGKFLAVFDELAEPSAQARENLKALYDILREPSVTFSDGVARRMSGVTIIATGNAGEEWFVGIPRNIPKFEQMFAMMEVFEEVTKDPGERRELLESYFSEALINRAGEKNIFFFGPLSFKAIRELAILKLNLALQALKATDSAWGWQVKFEAKKDYEALLSIIETDGFVVREQGASIDRFVNQDFQEELRSLLLRSEAPSGTNISITFERLVEDSSTNRRSSHWSIHIEGRNKPIPFVMVGNQDNKPIPQNEASQILTAYHEVGHELVRRALFGNRFRSTSISIIPGVAKIQGQWIRYLGLARSEKLLYIEPTRAGVVAELAVYLAGEAAESLVATQYTGGKRSDISKATDLAQRAILDLGLSERWGNYAPAPQTKAEDFISNLSSDKRRLFENEVERLLNEARNLARATLKANYATHFVPMALELAENGIMRTDDIEKYYTAIAPVQPKQNSFQPVKLTQWISSWFKKKPSVDAELLPTTARPTNVANIAELINELRQEEINSIVPAGPLPILHQSSDCQGAFASNF